MKNKTISIFMMLVLISTLFFGFAVTPVLGTTGTITLEDWEDYNVGVTSGSGDYFDWESGGEGSQPIISNDWNSPNKAWMIDASDDIDVGYLNLTTNFDYISQINLSMRTSSGDGCTYFKYIQFYDNEDNLLINIKFQNVEGEGWAHFWIEEADGSWNEDLFWGNLAWENDLNGYLVITHISGNDMNYSWYNSSGYLYDSVISTAYTLEDWTTFSYMKVYNDHLGWTSFWLDEIVIDITPTSAGDSSGNCNDGYNSIGLGEGTTDNVGVGYQCVELNYDVKFTGVINGFELFCTDYPINHPELYKSVSLYINNDFIGVPNNVFDEGDYYKLQWCSIDKSISDSEICYELWNPYVVGISEYFIFDVWNNIDSDGDGIGTFHAHSNSDLINGVINGGAVVGGLYDIYDLPYKMYYTLGDAGGSTGGDSVNDTDDFLSFNGVGYLGVHPTYEIPNFYQNTAVMITYNVQTLLNTNVMHIYYEDTWTDIGQTQDFPKTLFSGSTSIGFVPYNIGNYTVTIVRDSVVVANESFYSSELDTDYHIFTVPPVSMPLNSYQVFYIYNNSDYAGYIAMFDSIGSTNSFDNALWSKYIGTGDLSNVILFNGFPNKLIHYWRLFADISGTKTPASDVHVHPLSTLVLSNSISVPANIQLGINGTTIKAISYSHGYPLGDVGIYLNGNKIADVGNMISGYVNYEFSSSGFYNASLRITINGTEYTLVYVNFAVSEYGAYYGDGHDGILPDLGATWGMIMGLMIVSFFTLLPLLLTHMTNQKGFNFTIPAIVYVLFAGIGALISFAFELFQDWVLFFIIAIGIIALGILYLIGQRQPTGG